MNNNKAYESWILRLFKQTGSTGLTPHGKTYFSHSRYGASPYLWRNPFSSLFSGSTGEQIKWLPDTAGLQYFFERERSVSADGRAKVSHGENFVLNRPQEADAFVDFTSGAPLHAQFKVLNCYEETPDTKTFRLGRTNGRIFDYLPGQYITLSIVISGQEYKRSYSLASSPSRPGILEITVKRDPGGGLVSNWLADHLHTGDTVNVKGPFGKFSCALHASPKILLIAAGSGMVPIMSMLRWLTDTEACIDICLLLSFRTADDIIYRDELMLIAARHKNVHLAITLTADTLDRRQWPGSSGRVNEQMMACLTPDLPERTVYLCGPDAFMTECGKLLLQLNLAPEQLFRESFSVGCPPAKTEDSSVVRPMRSKTGNYRISFARSGTTVVADGRLTVLELVEQSGIAIARECRSGHCGECMIKCLQGSVEMTEQAEISDYDRKKGWLYACCAYPLSDIVLDI